MGLFMLKALTQKLINNKFVDAARRGRGDVLVKYLSKVDNVDITDDSGRTALIEAVIWNRVNLIKTLMEAGANLNLQDMGGPPLAWATRGGHPESVRLLIKAGVNVDKQDNYGTTSLMEAVDHHKYYYSFGEELEIIKLLIEAGANPNIQNQKGETALIKAINYSKLHDDYFKIISLLIEAGANPNIQYEEVFTAIDIAVNDNNIKAINILVEAGANIEHAVYRDIVNGRTLLLDILIKSGFDINNRLYGWNFSPIFIAVMNNNIEAVQKLIDVGVKLDSKSVTGSTLLEEATKKNYEEIINLLLKLGPGIEQIGP